MMNKSKIGGIFNIVPKMMSVFDLVMSVSVSEVIHCLTFNQNGLTLQQLQKRCTYVSSCSPHRSQALLFFMPHLYNLELIPMHLCNSLNWKLLIFVAIEDAYNFLKLFSIASPSISSSASSNCHFSIRWFGDSTTLDISRLYMNLLGFSISHIFMLAEGQLVGLVSKPFSTLRFVCFRLALSQSNCVISGRMQLRVSKEDLFI